MREGEGEVGGGGAGGGGEMLLRILLEEKHYVCLTSHDKCQHKYGTKSPDLCKSLQAQKGAQI